MTLQQYLLDRVIGKKAKFKVFLVSNLDGTHIRQTDIDGARFDDLSELHQDEDWIIDEVKGVKRRRMIIEDKIISVKPKRDLYIFKTLMGYEVLFHTGVDLDLFY